MHTERLLWRILFITPPTPAHPANNTIDAMAQYAKQIKAKNNAFHQRAPLNDARILRIHAVTTCPAVRIILFHSVAFSLEIASRGIITIGTWQVINSYERKRATNTGEKSERHTPEKKTTTTTPLHTLYGMHNAAARWWAHGAEHESAPEASENEQQQQQQKPATNYPSFESVHMRVYRSLSIRLERNVSLIWLFCCRAGSTFSSVRLNALANDKVLAAVTTRPTRFELVLEMCGAELPALLLLFVF